MKKKNQEEKVKTLNNTVKLHYFYRIKLRFSKIIIFVRAWHTTNIPIEDTPPPHKFIEQPAIERVEGVFSLLTRFFSFFLCLFSKKYFAKCQFLHSLFNLYLLIFKIAIETLFSIEIQKIIDFVICSNRIRS